MLTEKMKWKIIQSIDIYFKIVKYNSTALSEYYQRREYQNNAIATARQLLTILQRTIDIFEVDVNAYEPYVKDINREIELIKKWRQRDNKIKSYLNNG